MILFIYGEDSFRSRRKLSEYKERFLKKYGPQGDFRIINAEEKDLNLPEVARSIGLFSSVRLIIIKNALRHLPAEKLEKAKSFLKSDKNILSGKDVIMIFWEEEVPKKNNAFFKFLQKNAKLEEFTKLTGAKLIRWIGERLEEINQQVKINHTSAEKLAAFTAENTENINSELLKLANFKEKGEISENDVDKLVSAKLTTTIFETIESASGGNKKGALELLHRQLENKEDPFYILSMYAYQFRNLLKIGEYYWKGVSNNLDISKKTRIHPFVVQKTLPQLRGFTHSRLKELFCRLQKIDLESKTGKLNINLALDKFLVEL